MYIIERDARETRPVESCTEDHIYAIKHAETIFKLQRISATEWAFCNLCCSEGILNGEDTYLTMKTAIIEVSKVTTVYGFENFAEFIEWCKDED